MVTKYSASFRIGRFFFKPALIPSLCTGILITLFLYLSHWQWSKGIDRRDLELTTEQIILSTKKTPLTLPKAAELYQQLQLGLSDASIAINGQFAHAPLIIWDSRIYQQKTGYYLLAPFTPSSDPESVILINLGWHPLINQRRETLPFASLLQDQLTITGTLFIPHANRFVLDNTPIRGAKEQILVQRIESIQLSKLLDQKVYPFMIQADPDNNLLNQDLNHKDNLLETGLIRDWIKRTEIGINADKHFGYALQWFSFALILLGLYIGLNLHRSMPQSMMPKPSATQ